MDNQEIISSSINIDSNIVSLSLKNFTASEMDIFLAICYRCQKQGSAETKIPITVLRYLKRNNQPA